MPDHGPSIDLAACFARLAASAIADQRSEYDSHNQRALDCVHNRAWPLEERRAELKRWLDHYKVLMGFTQEQRTAISNAVLAWADARELHQHPTTPQGIDLAHQDLMDTCCTAYQGERGFNSLASKALWLCYPDNVPILDRHTQTVLQVLIQLEPNLAPARSGASAYEQFVHYWQQLFARYSGALDGQLANPGNECFHKTKIFDQVLWILGTPGYPLPGDQAGESVA